MNIALTGGNGFIGRRLRSTLAAAGHHVRLLCRRPDPAVATVPERMVIGDLSRPDCPLEQLVDGCDVVIHCAGEIRNRELMRALHVEGTRRLLETTCRAADRSGRRIHWVQLSSVGAYGPPVPADTEREVNEESPTRPVGEYEVTKTEADEMVQWAAGSGGLSWTIVRPSIVYGPGMTNGSLRALGRMVRRGLFFHIGRPGAIAPYVHVDDVADLLQVCALEARARAKIFNLSNDCLLTELIGGLARAQGVREPKLRLPEMPVRMLVRMISLAKRLPLTDERIDALVARTRYPLDKVRSELGFVPRRATPETIGEALLP